MDVKRVEKITAMSGKSYKFSDGDKTRPIAFWEQQSNEGKILFIVFYTQACRWSKCAGCNLPSQSCTEHVDFSDIMAQIDYIFDYAKLDMRSYAKLIISNNGSIFDEATFSTTALLYLIAQTNKRARRVTKICLETRPEYVDVEELTILSRALDEGHVKTQLEIAIGFEAFDEHIRNTMFDKGLRIEVFESFLNKVSKYNYCIKTYFMLKPVTEITTEDAIKDIHNSIDYIHECANKFDVVINMHLNPTYAARGTVLEEAFMRGDYRPPTMIDICKCIYHAKDKNLTLFIGLDDEGLATPGGSFIRPGDEQLMSVINKFNQTQDFDLIKQVLAEHGIGNFIDVKA